MREGLADGCWETEEEEEEEGWGFEEVDEGLEGVVLDEPGARLEGIALGRCRGLAEEGGWRGGRWDWSGD